MLADWEGERALKTDDGVNCSTCNAPRIKMSEFITSVRTNMQVMRHFLPLEFDESHVVGGVGGGGRALSDLCNEH